MSKVTSETTRKPTWFAWSNRDMDYSETKITDGHTTAYGHGYSNNVATANEDSQKEASREWNKKKR